MNPIHWLARPEFASLAAALGHFLWQGTLIAGLLAAVRRLWRLHSAQQRYACLLAALVAMALCPVITYIVIAPAGAVTAAGPQDVSAVGEQFASEDLVISSWPSIAPLAGQARPYLLALWLAGVCVLALRLIGGLAGVWGTPQQRLALPADLARRVERLAQVMGFSASPRVFLSRKVGEALAVGFWRPVVLVPAAWITEMPLEALEAVVAHELAHVRRFDLWVNLLQRIVETVLFYHPGVWWISQQLRQEREMCCDELAVAATGERLAYVEALELVARERLAGVRPALAAGIRGESNMKLLARVRNVLGGSADDSRSLWPAGLLALLLPLAMWGMTWGVFSPAPAAAVADDDRKDDDDGDDDDDRDQAGKKEKDRDDGDREERDRPRKEGEAGDKEHDDDDARERKEEAHKKQAVRKDGDRPRKEGEHRDGNAPKKGPRDGDVRKDPNKKEVHKEGEAPKKAPREGELRKDQIKKPIHKEGEVRKDPVKKEIRREHPEGDKKVVKEGAAPKKEDPNLAHSREHAGAAKLEAMIKDLRAENEKLRAEIRELRGDKSSKFEGKPEGKQIDKRQAEERDRFIEKLAGAGERRALAEKRERAGAEERALVEKKLHALAEQKERAVREAAEQKERAKIKEREAIERKEREIDRRREQERARADKEQDKK